MDTANVPGWVVDLVGIANFFEIFSAIAIVIIAVAAVLVLKQVLEILMEIKSIVETEVRKDILPSVADTLKNVKTMSDDAAATTHNVTVAANRVSNIVGTAATKMESPLIKAIGIASGLIAGARAVRGSRGEEPKKKRGFFG